MRAGRTTIVATQTERHRGDIPAGRRARRVRDVRPSATGALTIGRGESNTVRIDDPLASRAHACLHVGEAMSLEDVGSVNGTRVKDQPIQARRAGPIRIGETIQIGSSVLIVQRRTAQAELIRPETLRDKGLPIALAAPAAPRGEAMPGCTRWPARRRRHHQRPHHRRDRRGQGAAGRDGAPRCRRGASGPFVCLNCAALSETLLESELFGHERGRVHGRGAGQARACSRRRRGGTLFLDEVGELPLSTQAKLLRVIETREVARLGSVRPRRIDVRFIAATNRDLEAEVARGAFRAGSLLPAQRHRADDPAAARARLGRSGRWRRRSCAQICRDSAGRRRCCRPTSVAHLEAYGWPGNIRELKNVIERAVLLCEGQVLEPEHLPLERPLTESQKMTTSTAGPARSERDRIVEALAACAGNQSRAAKMLGIARRTFVTKLDAYKIPRPKKGA